MHSGTNRVLITGGLGYLGGRLASHLASLTPKISLRLSTRRNEDQIPQWAKQFDVVRADLLSQSSFDAILRGIDTVVHLAAVDELESIKNPEMALRVNGEGTYSLLKACHDNGVSRFVYLSTIHVYGPTAASPITEETPTRPVHPYAITHRLAEDFVNWFRHRYGLDTLVLRLSNGYGFPVDPSVQRWALVFNDVCRQAVQNGEIKLRSQGTQHRDFISITDFSRAISHLLWLPPEEWGDGLFNVGGDCSLSIREVADRIAAEFLEVYRKEVPVITGQAEDAQNSDPVTYSTKKLEQTGFSLVGNMSHEIRETFKICEQLEPKAS